LFFFSFSVIVDFVGRLAATKDDEDGPIFHEAKDWLVVVAEKDVLPALEMGIRFMNLGDRAAVWSHSKFAYGPLERTNDDYTLPVNSNVRYEITVKSIIPEQERSGVVFQISAARAKKEIANDVYANEWTDGQSRQRAISLYSRGAKAAEYILQTCDEETHLEEARVVMLDCLNNVAAVNMRAKEYHQAKEAAVKVLEQDPDNYKGLVRAAKASLLDPASSYEEVEAAIDAAAKNADAIDSELEKLRADLKKQKIEYKRKQKEMFSSKLGDTPKTTRVVEDPDTPEPAEPFCDPHAPAWKDVEKLAQAQNSASVEEEGGSFWTILKNVLGQYATQILIWLVVFFFVVYFRQEDIEDGYEAAGTPAMTEEAPVVATLRERIINELGEFALGLE
jgi:tetratricopeptide (TPR) repeat protein